MFLTNKKYTPEAIEISHKVAKNVEERFSQWLVSPKYKVQQDVVDSLLSLENRYCDAVIFDESQRVSRNQRILLRCEQDRVQAHHDKVRAKQNTLKYVVEDVCEHAATMLCSKLESTLISSLFNSIPDFNQFASIAYSPSLNFAKLHLLAEQHRALGTSLNEFVSNREFSEKYGKKPKVILDPKVAVGQLGIDNCKLLYPILMAQSMLKWSEENTKDIAPKLWQHLVVTASVTRLRLQETPVKDPDVGVLIGTMRVLPSFLIINHFAQVFEDALVHTMLRYREASDHHEEYYACSEVLPNTDFLSGVYHKLELKLVRKMIDHIDWTPNTSY
ncbi:MAG: hypothetical protein ACPG5L_15055, partial [Vibrio gallaecicus]